MEAQKSVGPDRMHLRILRELAHVTEIPHYNFWKAMRLGEVPYDWKKGKHDTQLQEEQGG